MSNPILSFSARRRMRSWRTPLLLTGYSLLLGLLAYVLVYAPFVQPTFTLGSMSYSVAGYMGIVALQFLLIILVAPAMTAGSISGERERQTLDLLRVTNMGPVRLVMGTLMESFAFLAILVLCSMPMLSLVLITGAATLGQVLMSVVFLLTAALGALSVGLWCSSLFKRTVASTVVSYLLVFAIGLLTLLPLVYDVRRIGEMYDALANAGTLATVETLDYTPIAFVMNPGLGLFSLLESQTGLLSGQFLWQISYTLGNTGAMLDYARCAYGNMAVMAAASLVLIGLSVVNMRLHRDGGGKGRKHA